MPIRLVWLAPFVIAAACAGKPAPATCPRPSIPWPESLDHPSTPETHRQAALELLDHNGSREVMTAMGEVALQAQLKANPVIAPYERQMREFLKRYNSYEALRDQLATLYMQKFTELQLRQMAAFYKTPTGELTAITQPQLVDEGAKLGSRVVMEHRQELVDMLRQATPAP